MGLSTQYFTVDANADVHNDADADANTVLIRMWMQKTKTALMTLMTLMTLPYC
jgi:hypothetical protein